MQRISSTQNPRIQLLRSLKEAKGRASAGCFLVEGRNLCEEALRDASVATLLVDEEKMENFSVLTEQAADVLLVPAHVMTCVCETKTPQGVAASVRMPASPCVQQMRGSVLVLDGVQDPGNVGTMIRTAEAAGFGGVFLSSHSADAYAPKTVRASMGSIFRVPILRTDLQETLPALTRAGYLLVSSELGGEPLLHTYHPSKPVALVIGSEGKGVSAAVSSLVDIRVSLPMRGRVESLNAAVAAGILMYMLQDTFADA